MTLQDTQQNPVTPVTPGTPAEKPIPVTPPVPDEEMVTHKAYAGIQTRLNKRNQEYEDLLQSQKALEEDRNRQAALAESRLNDLTTTRSQSSEVVTKFAEQSITVQRVEAFQALVDSKQLDLSPEATLKLFGLLGQVPVGKTPEETQANIKRLADFGQSVAKQHEQQLGQGATPGYAGATPQAAGPQTTEEWLKAVEGKDPSDPIFEGFRAFVIKGK